MTEDRSHLSRAAAANHISPQLLGTRSRRLCPRAVQQATAVLAAEIGCHTFRATGITASNLAG